MLLNCGNCTPHLSSSNLVIFDFADISMPDEERMNFSSISSLALMTVDQAEARSELYPAQLAIAVPQNYIMKPQSNSLSLWSRLFWLQCQKVQTIHRSQRFVSRRSFLKGVRLMGETYMSGKCVLPKLPLNGTYGKSTPRVVVFNSVQSQDSTNRLSSFVTVCGVRIFLLLAY